MRARLLFPLVLGLGCGPQPPALPSAGDGVGAGSTEASPDGVDEDVATGGDELPVTTGDSPATTGEPSATTGEPPATTGEPPATTMSAEIIVDQMPVQRPVQGVWPAGAFGGGQYLVAWEDRRARRPILYGARVAADGATVDPHGFPLLDTVPGSSLVWTYRPAVASDGTDFLVVSAVDGQIISVRVSAAGEVLDPGGFVVATAVNALSRPSVSFDGQRYLVAWSLWSEPAGSDNGIYRARVETDGTVLDPGGVFAYPLAGDPTLVGLSFDGSNTLLSWADADFEAQTASIEYGRVAADGTLVDGAAKQIGPLDVGNYPLMTAGFDGINHVIAWMGPGDMDHVMVSRVTPAGAAIDPLGLEIAAVDDAFRDVHRLDMAAGGGRSVIVWSTDGSDDGGNWSDDIRAVRFAADGAVSTPAIHELAAGLEATLVAQPDGALLLWRDGDDLYGDYTPIVGTRLDAAGAVVPGELAAATTASRQDVRAVASDGQIFFIVWADARERSGQGTALFGARLTADGTSLDGEPILLTDHRTDLADVVFDGANFVVTWMTLTGGEGDGNPFRSVRVSPAGERLDDEPLVPMLYSGGSTPIGASDGTHTLLVSDSEASPQRFAAVLIDQHGQVASEVVAFADDETFYPPAVASAGGGYLVLWHDSTTVFGQRIDESGALDGQPFSIVESDLVHHLELTSGGGNYLLVWVDIEGISAVRLGPDGQVLAPGVQPIVGLEPADGAWNCVGADVTPGNCPSAAFDGQNFVVAWRGPADLENADVMELHAAVVGGEGGVLQQFKLSEAPGRYGPPALVAGAGRVLVAYTGFVPGPPYDARRVLARVLVP